MRILITENKSVGKVNPVDYAVRVFINNDLHYGYFISEHFLFSLLTKEQQIEYLADATAILEVSIDVAQSVIDFGSTPFNKPKLKNASHEKGK